MCNKRTYGEMDTQHRDMLAKIGLRIEMLLFYHRVIRKILLRLLRVCWSHRRRSRRCRRHHCDFAFEILPGMEAKLDGKW